MDTDYLDTFTPEQWDEWRQEQADDYAEMEAAGLFEQPAEQPNEDYGEWPSQEEKDEYLLAECIAANNFAPYTPVEPMQIQEDE